MKKLIILCLIGISYQGVAQKKITIKDTSITEHISYAPDTIPVYFKELVIRQSEPDTLKGEHWALTDGVYEHWVKGYVIWQTYNQMGTSLTTSGVITFSNSYPQAQLSYYKNEYRQSDTLSDKFLYSDRKTKVTNKVIFSIKR